MLQIPSGRERTVSVAVEAELQESSAVYHLLRLDGGWFERAGCSHIKGTAHLTGVYQKTVTEIHDANQSDCVASSQGQCLSAVVLHFNITDSSSGS